MKFLRTNSKKMLAILGAAFVLFMTGGCSKKAECKIEGLHAHKYVNDKKMVRYIDQEYLNYEGYERQEEYIALDEIERKFYRFLDDRNLLRIDDNIDAIKCAQAENQDFTEYCYLEQYKRFVPMRLGKVTTIIPVNSVRTKWTRVPNHECLTGESKNYTYSYTSYKIEIDENGNYVLIPCPDHKDILSHKDEYPYIKEEYYEAVEKALEKETSKVFRKELIQKRA